MCVCLLEMSDEDFLKYKCTAINEIKKRCNKNIKNLLKRRDNINKLIERTRQEQETLDSLVPNNVPPLDGKQQLQLYNTLNSHFSELIKHAWDNIQVRDKIYEIHKDVGVGKITNSNVEHIIDKEWTLRSFKRERNGSSLSEVDMYCLDLEITKKNVHIKTRPTHVNNSFYLPNKSTELCSFIIYSRILHSRARKE